MRRPSAAAAAVVAAVVVAVVAVVAVAAVAAAFETQLFTVLSPYALLPSINKNIVFITKNAN